MLQTARMIYVYMLSAHLQASEEAKELFARHRGLIAIGGSEWPNIRRAERGGLLRATMLCRRCPLAGGGVHCKLLGTAKSL